MTSAICKVTGKISYESKHAALRARGFMRRDFKKALPYQCRHCKTWHLGRDHVKQPARSEP